MTRLALGLLRAGLGIGLLAYVLASLGSALPPLSAAGLWIGAFALFTLPAALLEVQRLRLLLAAQGLQLPFGPSLRIVTIGTFFAFCIPGGTGGDVMKVYYLASENRGRGVEIATSVLLDRVAGTLALLGLVLLLALPNLATVREHRVLLVLVLLAAGLALSVSLLGALAIVRGRDAAERVRGTALPLAAHLARILEALASLRGHRLALPSAVALSLAGHILLMAIFAGAARDLAAADDALASAFLAALGMFANALPVTPGGLGVGEYAFERLFALAGMVGGSFLLLAWRVGLVPIVIAGAVLYARGIREVRGEPGPRTAEPGTDG